MFDEIMYAQLDENNICTCISTYNTGIEATIKNLGQKRVFIDTYDNEIKNEFKNPETGEIETHTTIETVLGHWEYQDVPRPIEPNQPTNAEVAQMISDLYADLIIAGVIV